MKTIHKISLLLLSLVTVQTLHADDFDLYLLGLESESYTSLDFANLQSLSFTQTRENSVYVNRLYANYVDGTSKAFDLADYASIQFESTAVGIATPSATDSTQPIHIDGTHVIANQTGTLSIFSLDGRLCASHTLSAGESVSLQTLTAGTYIVKLGAQSAKILVK